MGRKGGDPESRARLRLRRFVIVSGVAAVIAGLLNTVVLGSSDGWVLGVIFGGVLPVLVPEAVLVSSVVLFAVLDRRRSRSLAEHWGALWAGSARLVARREPAISAGGSVDTDASWLSPIRSLIPDQGPTTSGRLYVFADRMAWSPKYRAGPATARGWELPLDHVRGWTIGDRGLLPDVNIVADDGPVSLVVWDWRALIAFFRSIGIRSIDDPSTNS